MSLWGGIKSFFGPKTTTQTQSLDPRSQAYVDQMRQQAQGAGQIAMGGPASGGSWFTGPQTQTIGQQAGAFMNPYMQNVLDPMRAEFDRLRDGAMMNTSQQATMGGAYGGSRAAALAGNRLGQLDAAQAQQTGNLLYSGYNNALSMGIPYAEQQRQLQEQQLQEPIWRQQMAQGFAQGGMGPTGWTQTQSSQGGQFGDLLKGGAGLAMTYFGAGGQMPSWLGGGGGGPSLAPLSQNVPYRQFGMPQTQPMTYPGRGIFG